MLGWFLFNAFVNDLEGRVRRSLIKFTGLLNWEVPVTPGKRRKKNAEGLRGVRQNRET